MNNNISLSQFKTKLRIAATILAAIMLLCTFSACSMRGADVVVAGSSSVQPFAETLAHEFERRNPGRKIDVQGGGSSAGVISTREGIADIGMSSRELKISEHDLQYTVIAKDGLAIIINPGNPIKQAKGADHVVDLSIEEIRGIYTGEITNWSMLGGTDSDIHVITREAGSGTRSAFEEHALDTSNTGNFITPKAIVLNSNGLIRMVVSDDPSAIGFISLGLVQIERQSGQSPVKPVEAIRIGSIDATEENVRSDAYPLARRFLFVFKNEPVGIAKDFLDFVLSDTGKSILNEAGLVTDSDIRESA